MKFNLFKLFLLTTALFITFTGCSDDDSFDNRESGYGYIQFKLYKEASYKPTDSRSMNSVLENLSDACKIRVEFMSGNTRFSQTMVLNSYSPETAEYGLRSEKLKLAIGDYTILGYTLYDALDKAIYETELNTTTSVSQGGVTIQDLTAKAKRKGKVNFSFVKDIDNSVATKATTSKDFMFTSVRYVSVAVRQSNQIINIQNVKAQYVSDFDKDDNNRQTGYLVTDSIIGIGGGDWSVISYALSNAEKTIIASATISQDLTFTVEDNELSKVDVPVKIDENQAYIQDYLALYEIWKALDGPNWSFQGEGFYTGCNWDFNKDIDLWGIQPGVSLHSNGRVGLINISGFGFQGHMPEALGQLTELAELYLGTHNDINGDHFNPTETVEGLAILGQLDAQRMEVGKKYLSQRHKSVVDRTVSPLLQSAYELRKIHTPGDIPNNNGGGVDFDQVIKPRSSFFRKSPATRADTNYGKICNGLKSLPASIGNLERLQTLFIANSTIESLPEEISLLGELTDLEIYNCPRMIKFPMVITSIPHLTALNISNNIQWTADDIYAGIEALGNSSCNEYLQLIFCNFNSLEALPQSFGNIQRIGLIDFSFNKIKGILPAYGKNINPVQVMFDNNEITGFPQNFCGYDDLESFTADYNQLTKFPNIFSKDGLQIKGVSFANNQIDGFDGENEVGENAFKGLNAASLNLSGNKLTKYPSILWTAGSMIGQINLGVNLISEFPDDSFTGERVYAIESIDLTSNYIKELPKDMNSRYLPSLYGLDLSYNQLSAFPWNLMSISGLTVLIIRTQRDEAGNRCFTEWPKDIGNHPGLRGLYLGSNDLKLVNESLSRMIFHLDISDNPNLTFYAGSICSLIRAGVYNFYYDRTQDIRECSSLPLDK